MKSAEFQGLLDCVTLSIVLFCYPDIIIAFRADMRSGPDSRPFTHQTTEYQHRREYKISLKSCAITTTSVRASQRVAARCLMEMGKASAWSTPGGYVNGLDNCQPPLPTGGESILWSGSNKQNQGVISLLMRSVDLCWAHTQRDNYDNKAIRILE